MNLKYFITKHFVYVCGKLNIFLVFKEEYGLVNKKHLSIKVNLLQSTTT